MLTPEERAQLDALERKRDDEDQGEQLAEAVEDVGAATVETVGEVAETVAEVIGEQVGQAHQAVTEQVVEQAAEQVREAEARADVAEVVAEIAEDRADRAEARTAEQVVELLEDNAEQLEPAEPALSVEVEGDVETLEVDQGEGQEPVELPAGRERSSGRRASRSGLLGTYGRRS